MRLSCGSVGVEGCCGSKGVVEEGSWSKGLNAKRKGSAGVVKIVVKVDMSRETQTRMVSRLSIRLAEAGS